MKIFLRKTPALVFALSMPCSAGTNLPLGQDVIILKSGEQRTGEIVAFANETFEMHVPLLPNQPSARIQIPRDRVQSVIFAQQSIDEALLTPNPDKIAAHQKRWEETRPFLGIPDSRSGEFGLAYAEALLANYQSSSNPSTANNIDIETALTICKEIEHESWNAVAKLRAQQDRLRAMIAVGKAAQAIDEAESVAASVEDPSVVIEAKYTLAQAAETKLRTLQSEHPRWQEDIWIMPERNQLYNEALDGYFYAPLFCGAEMPVAARGLWSAIQLYLLDGDIKSASALAQDLFTFYSESPQASQAQTLLNKLQQPRDHDPITPSPHP